MVGIQLHPCLPPGLSGDVLALEEGRDTAGSALAEHLVRFARALHGAGVAVAPGQVTSLLHAIEHTGLRRRDDLYYTAQATLLTRHEDQARFDLVFAQFFGPRLPEGYGVDPGTIPDSTNGEATSELEKAGGDAPNADADGAHAGGGHRDQLRRLAVESARQSEDGVGEDASPDAADEVDGVDRSGSYSAAEVLRRRDFSDLNRHEQRLVQQLMTRLGMRLAPRLTRRLRPSVRGRLDLRRSIRRSLRSGGELVAWKRRYRATKPRPLVLLCDVSGSMSIYSSMLLQFLHAARQQLPRVEAFVFSTRLTNITHQLRQRRPHDALAAVSDAVHDWSGGTRIGDSLGHFNRHWARRVLGRSALVLLISDGWDRGDVDHLRQEVAHLQRASYRLFWLNPLLGMPGYRPLTRGLQAALPHVDEFLPAHNLESLDRLCEVMAAVRGRRSPQAIRAIWPVDLEQARWNGAAPRKEG
ncbi:MAG: CoxE [Dehalococcoidia bacterium]|nr:CoxE [Dehalococcoidia bacterium]